MKDYTIIPNKHLPKEFYKAIRLITRPYIYITEQQYNEILAEAQRLHSDILIDCDGKQFTCGNCDNGHFALMPLIQRI